MHNVQIDARAEVESTEIGTGTCIGPNCAVSQAVRIGERCRIDANVELHDNVVLEDRVSIGRNTIVYPNVTIAAGTFVGPGCIIGERLAAFYRSPDTYPNPPLAIGRSSIIRSHTVLYAGSDLGDELQTGHHVVIREQSVVGHHCQIGSYSDIQGHVQIGDYCRCHSSVHVGQFSVIGNYVFIFPNSVLTNDPHPPSDSCTRGPTLLDYCVICAGAILMPAITIGKDSVVGANSLVTKDVESEKVVLGVPARPICTIHDIRCNEGNLEKPYPWREHFSRGMPWDSQQADGSV